MEFLQNTFLEIKKKYPGIHKKFQLDSKKNLFNHKKFLLSTKTLV